MLLILIVPLSQLILSQRHKQAFHLNVKLMAPITVRLTVMVLMVYLGFKDRLELLVTALYVFKLQQGLNARLHKILTLIIKCRRME